MWKACACPRRCFRSCRRSRHRRCRSIGWGRSGTHHLTGLHGVDTRPSRRGSCRRSRLRQRQPTGPHWLEPNHPRPTSHHRRHPGIQSGLPLKPQAWLGRHRVGRMGQGCRHSRRRPYRSTAYRLLGRRRRCRRLGRWSGSRLCPHRCRQTSNRRPHRFCHEPSRYGWRRDSKQRR